MKWKTANPPPKIGDVKVRRHFAWWPTMLDDGYTVWLESYGSEAELVGFYEGENWRTLRTYSLVVYY